MIYQIIRKFDLGKRTTPIIIKQNDNNSRMLKFWLFNNDLSEGAEDTPVDVTGCTVRLYMSLDENNSYYIDGAVEDGENGIISVVIPNGAIATAGDYKAEIIVTELSSHNIIATLTFMIAVEAAVKNDAAIEATSEYSALENALYKVDVANGRIDAFVTSATPGTDTELIDIRAGYDGTVYNSAGTAVREQIIDVRSDMSDLEDNIQSEISGLSSDIGATNSEIINARRGYDGIVHPSLGVAIRTQAESLDNQISNLKSDLNSGHTATPGYILTATNSGNGFTWSPVGLPTDAQTGQAVADWLDDHPEATTTVQDGSLTMEKFTDSLSLATENSYLTPQMFGAKGDGSTRDDAAITNALSEAARTGKTLYFPPGDYRIEVGINFEGICDIDMDGCLLYIGTGTCLRVAPPRGSGTGMRKLRLKVKRNEYSTDSVHQTVGIELVNVYSSNIEIVQSENFDIGFRLISLTSSCLLNSITLGDIKAAQHCVETVNTDGYVCNSNIFYGGYLRKCGTLSGQSCIWLEGNGNKLFGAYLEGNEYSEAHPDYKPWGTGIAIQGHNTYAVISVENCTHASSSGTDALLNYVELVSYSAHEVMSAAGSYYDFGTISTLEKFAATYFPNEVFTVRPAELYLDAAEQRTSGGVTTDGYIMACPSIKFQNSGTNGGTADTRWVSQTTGRATVANGKITMPSGSWLLAVEVDTSNAQEFCIKTDAKAAFFIKLFDANNNVITSASGLVMARDTPEIKTDYGGAYKIPWSSTYKIHFPFSITTSAKRMLVIIPNSALSYVTLLTGMKQSAVMLRNDFKVPFEPENVTTPGRIVATTTGVYVYDGSAWQQIAYNS